MPNDWLSPLALAVREGRRNMILPAPGKGSEGDPDGCLSVGCLSYSVLAVVVLAIIAGAVITLVGYFTA